MYYPYSKENIAIALKEVRGRSTKYPIIWETLKLSNVKGKTGFKQDVVYSFKTKDGKEYEMTVDGYYALGNCHRRIFRPCAITSVREKS